MNLPPYIKKESFRREANFRLEDKWNRLVWKKAHTSYFLPVRANYFTATSVEEIPKSLLIIFALATAIALLFFAPLSRNATPSEMLLDGLCAFFIIDAAPNLSLYYIYRHIFGEL